MTKKQVLVLSGRETMFPYRATYCIVIDEEGVVFHEGINHVPIGRNVNELPVALSCTP